MKYIWSLIVMCVIFLAFGQGASAYSDLSMTLSSDSVSGCQGTAIPVSVSVVNIDDATHTYFFTLQMPVGWVTPANGFIQPDITLASGEGRTITFWINPPSVAPGNYNVVLATKNGFEETANLNVEVLSCHSASVVVEENIDICEGTEFQYSSVIENTGKNTEEFEIIVSPSWDSVAHEGNAVIEPGEKTEISVYLTSPDNDGSITVKAVSKNSYAKAEANTVVNVRNCYDFSANLEPKETYACLGGSAKFELFLENTGEAADTFNIRFPDWIVVEKESVDVLPGEDAVIDVFAYPELKGKTSFDITVTSKSNKDKITLTGNIDTDECKGAAVIVSPAEQEVCKGNDAFLSVSLKNTGKMADTYDIETNIGSLEKNKANIEPGNVEKIALTIDTNDLEFGDNEIIVNASSGDMSDTNTVLLSVENCYSVEMAVTPENSDVCIGDYINYTLAVKNTGEFTDNYTFFFEDAQIGETTLEPNEIKIFTTGIAVDSDPGEHVFNFKAVSEYVSTEVGVEIIVNSMEDCYNIEMSSEKNTMSVDAGEGKAFEILLINSGSRPGTYAFHVEGPEWIFLSEDVAHLLPGETKNIYIYASPEYDIENGVYDVLFKAFSGMAEEELQLKFGVGVVPDDFESSNVQPDTNVPTGQITQFEMGSDTGKVILLAIIVFLIVVILAVKFVLFVK